MATTLPARPCRIPVALLLASASQFALAAQPAPEHIVTFVAGSATAGKRPLRLLDPLPAGARLRLEKGARLVVFRFRDAVETTLAGPGGFAVGRDGVTRTGAGGSLRQERIDPAFGSAAAGVQHAVQAGVTVRTGAAGASASPCEDAAVLPGEVVLRWSERTHTGDYGIVLADEAERVLHTDRIAGLEAAVPANLLAPGARYRWELSWRDASGSLRLQACRFVLLSAGDAADMARLRPAAGAPAARHTLFHLWLRARGAATPGLEP